MNNWKHYTGSILLAGLLLQGCGDAPTEDAPAATIDQGATTLEKFNASSSFLSGAKFETPAEKDRANLDLFLKIANLDATDSEMEKYVTDLIADNSEIITRKDAYNAIVKAIMGTNTVTASISRSAQRNIFSGLTDKIKGGLVDIMDSSLGGKVTGAMFDVVLNSDGVTVFMIDMARKSRTTSQIMIDAIGRNPNILTKMCPMLQENAEFGEKFTALAYEMYPETKEGAPDMGEFFFSVVDAPLYGCLTDAMLLSNNDAVHHESVEHSTNGYMGLLMERYASKFFIKPGTGVVPGTKYGSTDAFSSLMFDTGINVDYNGTSFSGHGDKNELSNEQLFYSLFKTPGSTNSFIGAMENINEADGDKLRTTMFMDKIFLGAEEGKETDAVQGYLNIIAIGSAMYDGIFGEMDDNNDRANGYGFSAYTSAFVDFAMLIPSDRYLAYGKGFMDAGFAYAEYNNISVWDKALAAGTAAGQDLWDNTINSNTPVTASDNAPARSAGAGYESEWFADSMMIFASAWSNISFSDLYAAAMNEDKTLLAGLFQGLTDQGNVAYNTVIDGRNSDTGATYPTTIINVTATNNEVLGFHGLIELAMREEIVKTQHSENNTSYTMTDAEAAFKLPLFADLTWSFAYTTATDGAVAYYNSFVDAGWLADLSTNELLREYFYPSADNVYIPSWLLAIDWLKLPDNVNAAKVADTDINFDAGYMDIYVVSPKATLLTTTETGDTVDEVVNGDIDLSTIAGLVKNIEISKIKMDSDSIIAVDENGQTLDGLYVYKVRTITPADTAAVMNYLSVLGDDALAAIGIDSDNAANTVTTAEELQ